VRAADEAGNAVAALEAETSLERARASLEAAQDRLRTTTRGFGAILAQLVADSTESAAAAQAALLRAELNGSGLAELVPSVRLFERALATYRSAPDATAAELVALVTGSPEPAR
jgi:prophage DNA circulation protein